MTRSNKPPTPMRGALPVLAVFLTGLLLLGLAGALTWPAALALGVCLALLAAVMSFRVARACSRVRRAMEGLGRGDFDTRMGLEGDGADSLVRTYNEAAAALKAAHAKHTLTARMYRDICDNSMLGVFQTSPDGRFIYANQAMAVILGYDSPDELTRAVRDLSLQVYTNPKRRHEFLALCRQGRGVKGFELEYLRQDGSKGFGVLNARPVMDEKGELKLIEGVATDITEKKLAEQDLIAGEANYRSLVENLKVGVYRTTLDSEGRFLYANAATAEILGYSGSDELLAARTSDVFKDPADRGLYVEKVMREGIVEDHVMELRKKDGSSVWVSETATMHLGPDGEPDWMDGVIEDVTERLDLERLERERKATEMAHQANSRFLTCISHELRTPMNAILGMMDMLQETELDAEQKRFLLVCQSAGDQLMEIINEILDLRTLEAGRVELHEEAFDLCRLVTDTCDALAHRILERDLAFTHHVEESALGSWTGDATRIRQILIHVVGNAIKFTETGRVDVNVRVDEAAPDAPLAVTVTDTGIGVPEDKLDRIFDSFFQVDASNTRRHGGTGMGLTVCRRLVELMGGSIQARSTPGQGSEFRIVLPLKRAVVPEEPRPEPAPAKRIRLLLMEDAENNRLLIKYYLRDTPYQVDTAVNGRAGVDMFKREPYDLVLMDIIMPEMDGYEATRAIREWERAEGREPAPIIAITARAYTEDEKKCMLAGCTAYEIKPVKREKLMELLKRHVA